MTIPINSAYAGRVPSALLWLLPMAVFILFEGLADVFAKEYSLRAHPLLWGLALGSYVLGNAFWLVALRQGAGLARGGMLFSLASTMLVLGLGLLVYREQTAPVQLVGMGLGVVALIMILWPA